MPLTNTIELIKNSTNASKRAKSLKYYLSKEDYQTTPMVRTFLQVYKFNKRMKITFKEIDVAPSFFGMSHNDVSINPKVSRERETNLIAI